MKLLLTAIMFACLNICTQAVAAELHLGRFSAGDISGWKEQTISRSKAKTVYTLTGSSKHRFLRANSSKSASGQIYKLNLDPKEYQELKWSWKIDRINSKGDEKTREGDDFAVRLYVVFSRGFFASNRAICYVWGNKLPKDKHVVSPISANIITVAVDSGNDLAGQWTFHQRNIYNDYKRFFREEPPKIGAIAIMTDTDNTGEISVGYYGDISLVSAAKANGAKLKDMKQKGTVNKVKEQPNSSNKLPSAAPKPMPKADDAKTFNQKSRGTTETDQTQNKTHHKKPFAAEPAAPAPQQ